MWRCDVRGNFHLGQQTLYQVTNCLSEYVRENFVARVLRIVAAPCTTHPWLQSTRAWELSCDRGVATSLASVQFVFPVLRQNESASDATRPL